MIVVQKKKYHYTITWVVNWASCFFHRIFLEKINKLFMLEYGTDIISKINEMSLYFQ